MKHYKNKLKDIRKSALRGNYSVIENITDKYSSVPYRKPFFIQISELLKYAEFSKIERNIIRTVLQAEKESNLYEKTRTQKTRSKVKQYINEQFKIDGDYEKLGNKKDTFKKEEYIY